MTGRSDKRQRVGRGLIIGGALAILVGRFVGVPSVLLIAPAGALIALIGGVCVGRRAFGFVALGIGVVSGLFWWIADFVTHDEGRHPGGSGRVLLWVLSAVAAVGVIGGLIIVNWPRRREQNPQGPDSDTPSP